MNELLQKFCLITDHI